MHVSRASQVPFEAISWSRLKVNLSTVKIKPHQQLNYYSKTMTFWAWKRKMKIQAKLEPCLDNQNWLFKNLLKWHPNIFGNCRTQFHFQLIQVSFSLHFIFGGNNLLSKQSADCLERKEKYWYSNLSTNIPVINLRVRLVLQNWNWIGIGIL